MRFVAFGVSVTGPLHLEQNLANQDAMVLAGHRGGWIMAIADGLGSCPHSEQGARRACQESKRLLRSGWHHQSQPAAMAKLHRQWIKAIAPTPPADAGSTLLVARVAQQGAALSAQIGDGLILIRSNGRFKNLTPERTGYSNQTDMLATSFSAHHWQTHTHQIARPGDGILLMTDGIADDLNPKLLEDFFDTLYRTLKTRSRRRGKRWMQAELNRWPTPLHGDDKTLVAVFGVSR